MSSNTSNQIEDKINLLAENYHATTDCVHQLQQTCANLLLDYTKHYQIDVLNRRDQIENQIEKFRS